MGDFAQRLGYLVPSSSEQSNLERKWLWQFDCISAHCTRQGTKFEQEGETQRCHPAAAFP